MKNLNSITIGNITLLTGLKAITVISFVAYLLFVICIGFFALESFISFLLFVALFLLCTHKPKPTKRQQLQNRINKRLLEISQEKRFNLSK